MCDNRRNLTNLIKISEKLFAENKTSPLLKIQEKDFHENEKAFIKTKKKQKTT